MAFNNSDNDILTEKEKKDRFQIVAAGNNMEIIYKSFHIPPKTELTLLIVSGFIVTIWLFACKTIQPINVPLGSNSTFIIYPNSPLVWFLLLFIAFGHSILFFVLKKIQKAEFNISGGYLSVKPEPKKKAGFSGFPVGDIKNIFVEKSGDLTNAAFGENMYFIMAETKSGGKIKLWGPSKEEKNLLFICRMLSNHLDRISGKEG